MIQQLDQLEQASLAELAGVASLDALETWRVSFLGSNGKLKAAMAGLKDVPKDQKPAVGARLNAYRY